MTAPGSQSPKRGRPPLGKTPDQPRPRTCHLDSEQGSQWSPTFCTKLLQFSFPPFPPKAWEEKAEAQEERARVLSHLTRQSNSSNSTGRPQGRDKFHITLISGHHMGRQEGHQAGQAASPPERLSSLCHVLVQWVPPALCPSLGWPLPSLAQSLHPLPLGGLGVGMGGVGLAGMCGAGGRVGDRSPSVPPLGASERPHPQASLSVLTGKEGMVTMVTGLSTVWPTSWGWCTT